ncbi:MAG: hypothetical protein JSR98_21395 [Proteobacteria bacterium]|nr:hypothetical protein [Pseudomonadota bacterium]
MKTLLPSLALAALIAGPALAQSAKAAPPPEANPTAAPPSSSSATPPGAVNPSPTPSPSSAAPPSSSAPTGSTADTAANAGASPGAVMSGMSVKDNTGALIGEVKAVKGGVATIQMGADTFTVDSSKLGVTNGVASINASQAELKKMLPKK